MNDHPRTALVTGAAAGIGLAIARALSAQGLNLILLDRDAGQAETVARELRPSGVRVTVVGTDLSDLEAVASIADGIARQGGCDVLVNNAGIHIKKNGARVLVGDIALNEWEAVMQVNLTAPFLLCQKLLPGMCAKGWGRIVNISSRAGRTFSPGASTHYSASKAGLIGFTRQLAGEVASRGVTVNGIAPGPVLTPLQMQNSPEIRQKLVQSVPTGRAADPAEIASAVAYLATEGASYINGAIIDVNGGGFMG